MNEVASERNVGGGYPLIQRLLGERIELKACVTGYKDFMRLVIVLDAKVAWFRSM
eukprot:c16277_g2_i1 orf=94-258(+)